MRSFVVETVGQVLEMVKFLLGDFAQLPAQATDLARCIRARLLCATARATKSSASAAIHSGSPAFISSPVPWRDSKALPARVRTGTPIHKLSTVVVMPGVRLLKLPKVMRPWVSAGSGVTCVGATGGVKQR